MSPSPNRPCSSRFKLFHSILCYNSLMTVEQNNLADETNWQKYIAGNDQALVSLFEKYNSRFMAYLSSRKCKDPETICQEGWSRIIAKKNSFDGKSFSGWSFRIIRNLFAEQVRKAVSRNTKQLTSETCVVQQSDAFGLAKLEAKERMAVVKACVEAVGEPFLTVFRMKTLDNMKAKEIAAVIGVAENTIHTRVSRAKQKIKDCVKTKLP